MQKGAKMQKKPELSPNQIPTPEAFRVWLRAALLALDLSAGRLGRDLGLGKNTLGDFLATPGRDLRLGNAAQVHDALRAHAVAQGKPLAPLCAAAHV